MQKVLFFSRVAFICNVCFVLTALLKYYPSLHMNDGIATILVLGLPVATVLNLAVNTVLLILLVTRKLAWGRLPPWLIITNFLFLIPQLILFLA